MTARTLSPAAVEAMTAAETGEVFLVCLTITHPEILDGPIRVVNDLSDMDRTIDTDDGPLAVTFIGLPFEIQLAGEDAERPTTTQLKVDNVDRRIVEAVRSITSPASVDVEVVLASQPDTVEIGMYDLTMRSASYDALYVETELQVEQIFAEPISVEMTPQRFPAMF